MKVTPSDQRHPTRAQFRAVLLGVAIGDALGAPVEFLSLERILATYGSDGVTDLEPWDSHPAGSYTDDTQMTIATALGTLAAVRAGAFGTSDEAAPYVWQAYLDWYETQNDPANRRGPGTTCTSALAGGVMGTAEEAVNDSKGCGTIMRIAPCALLYPDDPYHWASVCSAMTHGHDTGFVAAAAFAEILHRVLLGEALDVAIRATLGVLVEVGEAARETRDVLQQVIDAHEDGVPLPIRIVEIGVEPLVAGHGRGWVAEEALAIALSCALVHPTDFSAAVLSAVNITGDSDSTGSVTGALMGAMLGLEAIPGEWRERVEGAGMIAGLAGELWEAAGTQGG